jgi:hypothetical protein
MIRIRFLKGFWTVCSGNQPVACFDSLAKLWEALA